MNQEETTMDQQVDGVKKDKAGLFRALGSKRVSSALKRIALIGNLSNRQAYTYSDVDTKKLFDTLRKAIDRCEARFTPKAKDTDSFEF
jgi:hypothetical protein